MYLSRSYLKFQITPTGRFQESLFLSRYINPYVTTSIHQAIRQDHHLSAIIFHDLRTGSVENRTSATSLGGCPRRVKGTLAMMKRSDFRRGLRGVGGGARPESGSCTTRGIRSLGIISRFVRLVVLLLMTWCAEDSWIGLMLCGEAIVEGSKR